MMSSFHLAPPELPGNFAIFPLLSVEELLSTNNTIFVIGRTNSRCSVPLSLSLLVRTIPCLSENVSIMRAIGQLFRLKSAFRRETSPF